MKITNSFRNYTNPFTTFLGKFLPGDVHRHSVTHTRAHTHTYSLVCRLNSPVYLDVFEMFRVKCRHRLILQKLYWDSNPGHNVLPACGVARLNLCTVETTYSKHSCTTCRELLNQKHPVIIHTNIHTYIHTYIHTCTIHTYIHTHLHTYTHARSMHTYTIHAYIHTVL